MIQISRGLRCVLTMAVTLTFGVGVALAQRAVVPSAAQIAQSGQLTGSTYANKSLGFTLSVPAEWNLASEEMNKAMLAAGGKTVVANEAGSRRKALEESLAKTAILFTLSRFPIGTAGNTGNLACGFERTPAGYTLSRYANDNQSFLQKAIPGAKITKANYATTIGGKPSLAFDLEAEQNGALVRQRYYLMQRKGGMLFFVMTWSDEDDIKRGLDTAFDSIKFDK